MVASGTRSFPAVASPPRQQQQLSHHTAKQDRRQSPQIQPNIATSQNRGNPNRVILGGSVGQNVHHHHHHHAGTNNGNNNNHHRRLSHATGETNSSATAAVGAPGDDDNDEEDSSKKLKRRRIYHWVSSLVVTWRANYSRRTRLLAICAFLVLCPVAIWCILLAIRRLIRLLQGEQLPPDSTLDFLVAGFPKSGTTTLLAALGKHEQIAMDSQENCQIARPIQQDDVNLKRLNRYLDAMRRTVLKERVEADMLRRQSKGNRQAISTYDISSLQDNLLLGIKCPDAIKNFKAIHRLSQHSPNCKFVIGVRHPIWFLQSFYNYRVLEAHLKNKVETIPSLYDIYEENRNWWDISPDATRYELFLSQFGKTDMHVQQLQDWFIDRPMLAVKPNRFRIFLYTLEQVQDDAQSQELRRDLQHFLGLTTEIPPFGHENRQVHGTTRYPESIDICAPEYHRIRAIALEHAQATVDWMLDQFLNSPDVVVSNRPFMLESIQKWSTDPCTVMTS